MDIVNKLVEKLKNPLIAALVAVVLGFAFGLIWGWAIQPVEWTDAVPELLNADYQREYLRMTIDSFLVNSDTTLALQRWQALGTDAPARLAEISANPGPQDQATITVFSQLIAAAAPSNLTGTAGGETQAATPAPTGNTTPKTMQYVLIVLGIVAIGAVAYLVMRVLRPLSSKNESPAQQALKHAQSVEKTDFESMGLATPITRSMTTYVLGDDLYDESFSIESQAGEFLGEYGVGISDTIGVGDPKKVAALEIWLFDKNDIKTATKVLMSEHAFSDPEIVQRLEAKGELVLLRAGEPVKLETETLQILVTAADLEYGSGPLPPNSYFDRVTLELAVWPKQAPAADGAAG